MRKKWFKKLGAAFCAAVLSISCMNLTAFAEGETITKFDTTDYQTMSGLSDATGSIEIEKKTSDVTHTSFDSDAKPIAGVNFSVKKIGEYATVVDAYGKTSVMIGIDKTLAAGLLDLSVISAAPSDNSYVYLTSTQAEQINTALKSKSATEYKTYIDPSRDNATDTNGKVKYTGLDFGIYLVLETSVTNAKVDGKPISFSKKQYPYIVSVPLNNNNGTWTADIQARAKNDDTSVTNDKKIVRDSHEPSGLDGLHENDVTHIGDTVEFTLTTGVPIIDSESSEEIEKYNIQDAICEGLTLPTAFATEAIEGQDVNLYVRDNHGTPYNLNTDFTIERNDVATDQLYTNGSQFTISFNETGLGKLTALAKDDSADKWIKVNYTATVNGDAVVGTTGNPNKSRLTYKSAGSAEISTGWKEVREFIFTMEGKKTFDGATNNTSAASVTFELYLDEGCTTGVVLTGTAGDYTYGGTGSATSIALDGSKFTVKGVPVNYEESTTAVTLYLKETATASGYNKLTKVIPITLNPSKTGDNYSGTLDSTTTTVNGKTASLNADSTGVSFTVDNTSGFELPSTGGMGIWMFVIAGILVIAAGIFYYRKSKKRA